MVKEDDILKNYSVTTKNVGEWWIGWIEEVPGVNCQENTYEELLESLRVTMVEANQLLDQAIPAYGNHIH